MFDHETFLFFGGSKYFYFFQGGEAVGLENINLKKYRTSNERERAEAAERRVLDPST